MRLCDAGAAGFGASAPAVGGLVGSRESLTRVGRLEEKHHFFVEPFPHTVEERVT